MSRTQFWILNLVGGLCALLILSNVVLALLNQRLNRSVTATQNQFSHAQQLQSTTENLLTRMAQAGRDEPSLRELLRRHDFDVNVNRRSPQPAP